MKYGMFNYLVVCGFVVVSCAMAEGPSTVLNADGQTPEPTVKIDNVCAWPNLTLLPDGTIIACIYNQPSHGRMVGDVDCYGSTDQGVSWTKRGTVAPHEPGSLNNRMSRAVGLAHNGDLVAICGGWTLREKAPGEAGTGFDGPLDVDVLLRPWVCRSSDGGRNWEVDKKAFPTHSPDGGQFIVTGDVVRSDDGTLRVAAYGTRRDVKPRTYYAYILTSHDDGRTWEDPAAIDPELMLNETYLMNMGNGRYLALARHDRLEVYQSTDHAKTWSHLTTATESKQIPGHLLRLKDGRLLLSYGDRTKGKEGVSVKVSTDGGMAWSASRRVVDFNGFDGGYPATVELPGGIMFTAYYAKETTYHDRYHMGGVRWDLSTSLPLP